MESAQSDFINEYLAKTEYLSRWFTYKPILTSISTLVFTTIAAIICFVIDVQHGLLYYVSILCLIACLTLFISLIAYHIKSDANSLTIFCILAATTYITCAIMVLLILVLLVFYAWPLSISMRLSLPMRLSLLLLPPLAVLFCWIRMNYFVTKKRIKRLGTDNPFTTFLFEGFYKTGTLALGLFMALRLFGSSILYIIAAYTFFLLYSCCSLWLATAYGMIAFWAKKYSIEDWLPHPEDDEIPWALRDDVDATQPPQHRS